MHIIHSLCLILIILQSFRYISTIKSHDLWKSKLTESLILLFHSELCRVHLKKYMQTYFSESVNPEPSSA